jgi:hypothetical protein
MYHQESEDHEHHDGRPKGGRTTPQRFTNRHWQCEHPEVRDLDDEEHGDRDGGQNEAVACGRSDGRHRPG